MSDVLPEGLLDAIREGRAVLMLGAGASYGAKNDKHEIIPLGADVAKELIAKFLAPEYAGIDFRTAYDLACSQRDVRTVQNYLHDRLLPFQPTEHHKILPTFYWSGILTTNYDLLIERSYADKDVKSLQRIIPHVKDADGATSGLGSDGLLYVKMHGCITRYDEIDPPMLASTEQLIGYKSGRVGQFNTFLEWSKTKTIIFVGYGFADSNIRQLLDAVIREGDARPRHYLIDPGILPAMQEYWSDRRITAFKMTFKEFIEEIDKQISSVARALISVQAASIENTTFTKFISAPGRQESPELREYLKSTQVHVTGTYDGPNEDPKKFYRGFDLGWYPFHADLDVKRVVGDDILSDKIITETHKPETYFFALKGHAGSGKSTTMRRVCWDAATTYDKLCVFINREASFKVELLLEMASLTNRRLHVFVDGLSVHRRQTIELLRRSSANNYQITVIGAETFNVWNALSEELDPHLTQDYEMRPMSESDIDKLLVKLESHDSLGVLKDKSPSERKQAFVIAYGRQILVALLEVTHGVPLVEIITDEYRNIEPAAARQMYIDICSLHRYGPPVRAGLISRLHDITFEDFEKNFFKPLEQVIHARPDRKSGDLVYEARHPYIADTLYTNVVTAQDERFDNIARIITKLNPSYQYDMEALSRIVRADSVLNLISDQNRARQIYDLAIEAVGKRPFILQQRGIYESRIANNMGMLKQAGDWLQEAESLEPWNRSIKHSIAELDYRRSQVAEDQLERVSWRRAAVSQASSLTLGGKSPYPHHTLMKAAIDEVAEALERVEASPNDVNARSLSSSISDAEATLRRGFAAFPNDGLLLKAEGDLAETLSHSDRAEEAFKLAFKTNPRSTVVARRLVRIYNSKGEFKKSLEVLRQALSADPAAQELHYEVAMAVIKSDPTADQAQSEAILHHLRRSFTFGDRNYRAQFWYARQLCLSGQALDAKPIYDHFANISMPYTQRTRVQGVVMRSTSEAKRFAGRVRVFRSTYGVVSVTAPTMIAYAQGADFSSSPQPYYTDTPVSFELGFNYKGPVAIDVRHTSDI